MRSPYHALNIHQWVPHPSTFFCRRVGGHALQPSDILFPVPEALVRKFLFSVCPTAGLSSRPGEFHPEALTEPCLNLSIHTALHSPAFVSHEHKPSLEE